VPRNFTFNPPPWNGSAILIATLWTLHKGDRRALCTLWNHPHGAELRLDVEGRESVARVSRDFELLLDLSDELNATLIARGGWSEPLSVDPSSEAR
jgi:hypothetical protein